MQRNSYSDRYLLQHSWLKNRPERGTSYCKLNESVIKPKYQFLSKHLRTSDFQSDYIKIEYEQQKLFMRDLLCVQSIKKNKSWTVAQKEAWKYWL